MIPAMGANKRDVRPRKLLETSHNAYIGRGGKRREVERTAESKKPRAMSRRRRERKQKGERKGKEKREEGKRRGEQSALL